VSGTQETVNVVVAVTVRPGDLRHRQTVAEDALRTRRRDDLRRFWRS
jgi:hypothetical protein